MIKLSTSEPGFDRQFQALVDARREADADVALRRSHDRGQCARRG